MRKLYLIFALLVCGLLVGIARADTFKLTNGDTLSGEVLPSSANDQGVQVKVGEGQYQRVPWANFSQPDLKNFAKNQKLEGFVEPFIEITQEEKIKKTEVNIKQPPRLERPARQSLFGALFSSSLGLFLVVVLYAANIYAGYEVAVFRAQPPLVVCGLSAVPGLGFAAPIAFLSMPTRMKGSGEAVVEGTSEAALEAAAAASGGSPGTAAPAAGAETVNPMQGSGVDHPAGLHLHTDTPAAKAALPPTTTYQRGQFTFNRRFFETKFSGFFGAVRRDADRDMELIVKSLRGEYNVHRISRIAANDVHLEVQHGPATQEVMVSFQEIQEIRLKHKDA